MSDSFLESLGIEGGVDLEGVERRFIEHVKERLQHIATQYDETELKHEEEWLKRFHEEFFTYSLQWARGEMERVKVVPNHHDAAKLKKKARDLVDNLQKHIIEFSRCYMHINRFETLLRDEIRREEIRLGGDVPKNVKWTLDAGNVIARYKKQKNMLVADNLRMAAARKILEPLDKDFVALKAAIIRLYGIDKLESLQRPMIAALRTLDYRRARKAVREILDEKKKFGADVKTVEADLRIIQKAGESIIEICQKNEKSLVSAENRLYLRPIETDQAYNAQARELQKIKGFLAKYHLPYMQYKLDTLSHLRDKMTVIATLEGLMGLYNRLLMGIARPISDIKELRLFENEVLDRASYLMSGHLQEVPKILARAAETVAEFRKEDREFREIESLQVEEIDIQEEP